LAMFSEGDLRSTHSLGTLRVGFALRDWREQEQVPRWSLQEALH